MKRHGRFQNIGLMETVISSEKDSENDNTFRLDNFHPRGISFGDEGDIFIADSWNSIIWKVPHGNFSQVEPFAGVGDIGYSGNNSIASSAHFNGVEGITYHNSKLFVVDSGNNRVRAICLQSNIITNFAGNGKQGFSGNDGLAITARLNRPHSIVFGKDSVAYLSDTYNHCIRRIEKGFISSLVTPVINNLGFVDFSFHKPTGLAIDSQYLFVSDSNSRVVRIRLDNNGWEVIIGRDSVSKIHRFSLNYPQGLCLSHNKLFVLDSSNIYSYDLQNTSKPLTLVGGNGVEAFNGDGISTDMSIRQPSSIIIDGDMNILFSDSGNHRLRKIRVAEVREIQEWQDIRMTEIMSRLAKVERDYQIVQTTLSIIVITFVITLLFLRKSRN